MKPEYGANDDEIIHIADYYVAVWGDDSNLGTYEKPWGTWQKAFESAQPGDTVYFRGGVWLPEEHASGANVCYYDPTATSPYGYNGTAENRIYYMNYPGETPILDCSLVPPAGNFNTALELKSVHFVTFRGLTIRNLRQHSSNVTVRVMMAYLCSNLTFERFTIHNNSGAAFNYLSGIGPEHGIDYDTTRWINCDAYYNVDSLGSTPGNHADGWKCDQYEGAYLYFEGCRAMFNADDGFDVSGPTFAVFDNCWAISNGLLSGGNGNGFKTGAIRDTVDTPTRIIVNCLAAFNHGHNNSGAGFDFVDYQIDEEAYYRVNARVYNNTSYKNDIGYLAFNNPIKPYRNTVFRNNIAYGSTYVQDNIAYDVYIADYQYPESNNSWDFLNDSWPPWFTYSEDVEVTDDDFVSLNPAGLTGPRQKDGSLPVVDFMRLKDNSDLIDAGTQIPPEDNINYVLDYKGIAPDLGCFEKR